MSPAARIATFTALLVTVFALAGFAGRAADLGRTPTPGKPAGHSMDGAHDGADPVRGLAVSQDSLTLGLDPASPTPGRRFTLRFAIRDANGHVVRDFDVEHTRRMHLILARRDLSGFQHLHPTQAADGSWSAPVTLRDPGTYRVFADFSTGGKPRTLGSDLTADGAVRSRPLPQPVPAVRVDGLGVRLASGRPRAGREAELSYQVTHAGRPVQIAPYLGARGHLVALREGDLAFLHVHPEADRLRFMAQFPSAGRYRVFLQFRAGGRLHTAPFTVEVAR
jgi:hypothetical protein